MNSYCVGLDHSGLVRGAWGQQRLAISNERRSPGLGLRVQGGWAFNSPLRRLCEPAAGSPSQSSQSLRRGGGAEKRLVWREGQKQLRLRGGMWSAGCCRDPGARGHGC